MAITRPICATCNKNYCAKNYTRNDVIHYRSKCADCRKNKPRKKRKVYGWERAGYQKKPHCDLCGFKAAFPGQLLVFYTDGNLENTALTNLKTVCLNCVEVVKHKNITWKRGDLLVDY